MRYGGAERVISILLKHFAGKDFELYLILLENDIKYEIPKGVKIISLHNNLSGSFRKLLSILIDPFRLKRIVVKENIEVVISFLERANFINILSRKVGGNHKVIASVRNIISKVYKRYSIPNIFMRFLCRILLSQADLIIPNSDEGARDLIINFHNPKSKIRVIYNPIDVNKIYYMSSEATRDLFDGNKKTVINIARFHKAKGHAYLVKAFYSLVQKVDAQLILIGDGEERKIIETLVKSLGIKGKVYFLGFQHNPFKFLRHASVFVLSSTTEGFPNVLLEALACQLPVVATSCSDGVFTILAPNIGHSSFKYGIFEGEYGIIVPPEDPDSLYRAMLLILTDDKLQKIYRERSLGALERFEAAKISLLWEECLSIVKKEEVV